MAASSERDLPLADLVTASHSAMATGFQEMKAAHIASFRSVTLYGIAGLMLRYRLRNMIVSFCVQISSRVVFGARPHGLSNDSQPETNNLFRMALLGTFLQSPR